MRPVIVDNDSSSLNHLIKLVKRTLGEPRVIHYTHLADTPIDTTSPVILSGSHTLTAAWHDDIFKTELKLIRSHKGPTETGFATNAHATKNSLFARKLPTAEYVAAKGWRGMKNGKAIVLIGKRDRLSIFIARFLPRSLIRSVVGKTQR